MFKRPHGAPKKSSTDKTPVAGCIAMLKPDAILCDAKIAPLLSRIQELCSIDVTHDATFYLTLVQQLASYVDMLPDSTHTDYTVRAGLLEYALHRTEVALSLFQPSLIYDQEGHLSDIQRCWQFAFFSAALLRGIGKLYLDYHVELYDAKGAHLQRWNPCLGPLYFPDGYYTYKMQHDLNHDFRRRVTLLLAKDIMIPSGMCWIMSEPLVFEAWLGLLDEEVRGVRILEAILDLAEDVLYAREIEAQLEKLEKMQHKAFLTFDPNPAESMTQAGLLFLQWLQQALESGKLCLNDGGLTVTDEGLMLKDEVFRAFVKDNLQYKNWQAVQKGFLSLGFHDSSANTAEILFARFGMVLPAKAMFLNTVTGQKSWVSALELAHFVAKGARLAVSDTIEAVSAVPKLTEKGVWQQPEEGPFLKPGQRHRG